MSDIPKCHKLSNVLVDAKVEADFPRLFKYHHRDLEPAKRAEMLEDAVTSFNCFVRDHRSQDPVELTVVGVRKDLCSHCQREWETCVEDDKSVCCANCGTVVEEPSDVKTT